MALVPPLTNADPLEPRLPDSYGYRGTVEYEDTVGPALEPGDRLGAGDLPTLNDANVLTLLADSMRVSRNYLQYHLDRWEWAEMAWRSQHYSLSKYRKDLYKNRAHYFKPKTRASIMKALAATRAALFASQDVLVIDAADDGNPKQRANAALLKTILNQRFNNKTIKSGVPWKRIALAARLDAQKMGICASKQYWCYEAQTRTIPETVTQQAMSANGEGVVNLDGTPFMETVTVNRVEKNVQKDKPDIILIPPENIRLDPTASWINPAQDSPFLIVPWPMRYDDLARMMEPNDKSPIKWRKLNTADINQNYYTEAELMGLKVAREGDKATATTSRGAGPGRYGHLYSEILDVRECFFRIDGTDYHCWTLGDRVLLSDPIPTEEAYPAMRGIRPIVLGTDAIEPHMVYPESHAYSWRQQQDELNDSTNIQMDASRKSVYPVAKVVRGRLIDYRQVQRHDQSGIIQVKEANDVTWDRPPAPGSGMLDVINRVSNDFDELAGNFSQNSVQTNRSLNETVGGMQLIAANAGATSELFLDIWIDSYAEPVMSQVVMLEQYYEDDATLLAVAGQKAQLWERFGIDEITDELLESQINISLDLTIGGADPMMRLMKLKTVNDLAMPMIQLAQTQGQVKKIKFEEFIGEMYSFAGYRNGADRFIEFVPEGEEAPMPPDQIQALQQQLQALTAENEKLKSKEGVDMAKVQAGLQSTEMSEQGDTQRQQMAEEHDERMFQLQRMADMLMQAIAPPPAPAQQAYR